MLSPEGFLMSNRDEKNAVVFRRLINHNKLSASNNSLHLNGCILKKLNSLTRVIID